MREIKFRAWDKKNKEWLEIFWISNYGNFFRPKQYSENPIELDENYKGKFIEIVQYTGLKDKNGKGNECYESDIVEFQDPHMDEFESKIEIAVVTYSEACFYAKMNEESAYPLLAVKDQFEIIGNIYEHKHLLDK